MNRTLLGCATASIGYVAFAGLTIAGVTGAPLAILLVPVGLAAVAPERK